MQLPQGNTLYIDTVPSTQTAPAAERMQVLAALVDPEDRASKADQLEQRSEAKSLGLEDALEEGQVDDAGLASERAHHGIVEHFVTEKRQLAAQDGLAFATAGQRVEHVEEDETRECHGSVVSSDNPGTLVKGLAVGDVAHFVDIDGESANHDHQGRGQNSLDERACKNAGVLGTWGAVHDRGVNGLNTEGLRRWAIHKNICDKVSEAAHE